MYQVQHATIFSRRSFMMRWALVTTIVGVIGTALCFGISMGLGNAINDAYGWDEGFEGIGGLLIAGLMGLIILGAVVGYGQSKVLERELGPAGRWTMATAIALPISALLSLRAFSGLSILLPGAMLGFAQMLVLLRHTPRAGWWIAGSSLAVAIALGLAVMLIMGGQSIAAIVAGWICYASASAAAMAWLLGRR